MGLLKFSLDGKVALVTGARRGIGRAMALALAEAGADVAICDNVAEGGEMEAVVKEIQQFGRRSLAVQADVTRKSEVDSMVGKVEGELGPIDILVNNAGIGGGSTMLETSEELWHKVIDVNLTGCFLCSQAVGKRMAEREGGNIISIASAAGIRGFSGRNTYNVSKAGVIMLTKILARDWGKYGIRVNAIAPSIVKTEMAKSYAEDPKAEAAEAARIPAGRLGVVADFAGPVVFLASDASSYVTGHTLVVDGGQLA